MTAVSLGLLALVEGSADPVAIPCSPDGRRPMLATIRYLSGKSDSVFAIPQAPGGMMGLALPLSRTSRACGPA